MFKITGKEEKINFEGFNFKYILKNKSYDTDHLVIVFSGFGGRSLFTYDFKNALFSSRSYVLWIKDDFFENNMATYYVDPAYHEKEKLETAIIKFIEKVINFLQLNRDDCTILGASKGGASALYYGIKYNFKNILVSAPTLLIGSSVAGIIPKAKVKTPAKFMLGENLDKINILKLDSLILNAIEKDNNYNRNIYLLSSKRDNKYPGQVAPFLGLFYKYHNFNFIESQSVLVQRHEDVTSHNAPLIMSILNCLVFTLQPTFINSVIQSSSIDKKIEPTKKPVLEVEKLKFDINGRFYIEGVFFLRGLSCANYSDVQYILKLRSENFQYDIPLAKANNKKLSKYYFEGHYVNYDKAFFCTKNFEGLDMTHVKPDSYKLFIEIKMNTGETCELPLTLKENYKQEVIYDKIKQAFHSSDNSTKYIKFSKDTES